MKTVNSWRALSLDFGEAGSSCFPTGVEMIVGISISRQSWHPVQVLCVIKALQKHNF